MVSPSDWSTPVSVAFVNCGRRREISIRVGQDHRWHVEVRGGGGGAKVAEPRIIEVRVCGAWAQIEVTLDFGLEQHQCTIAAGVERDFAPAEALRVCRHLVTGPAAAQLGVLVKPPVDRELAALDLQNAHVHALRLAMNGRDVGIFMFESQALDAVESYALAARHLLHAPPCYSAMYVYADVRSAWTQTLVPLFPGPAQSPPPVTPARAAPAASASPASSIWTGGLTPARDSLGRAPPVGAPAFATPNSSGGAAQPGDTPVAAGAMDVDTGGDGAPRRGTRDTPTPPNAPPPPARDAPPTISVGFGGRGGRGGGRGAGRGAGRGFYPLVWDPRFLPSDAEEAAWRNAVAAAPSDGLAKRQRLTE